MDDESPRLLIERALRRDRDAFAELVRRYERSALAIAYAIVGNSTSAGDVTQDAFLKAWQRLGDLDDPNRFPAWLARIVRNLAADHCRRRPRESEWPDDRQIDGPQHMIDPMQFMDHADRTAQIDDALSKLDELTRSAVVLKYYEGLSSKQIAELLEISSAAVDMRLSRARTELREKLATLSER